VRAEYEQMLFLANRVKIITENYLQNENIPVMSVATTCSNIQETLVLSLSGVLKPIL